MNYYNTGYFYISLALLMTAVQVKAEVISEPAYGTFSIAEYYRLAQEYSCLAQDCVQARYAYVPTPIRDTIVHFKVAGLNCKTKRAVKQLTKRFEEKYTTSVYSDLYDVVGQMLTSAKSAGNLDVLIESLENYKKELESGDADIVVKIEEDPQSSTFKRTLSVYCNMLFKEQVAQFKDLKSSQQPQSEWGLVFKNLTSSDSQITSGNSITLAGNQNVQGNLVANSVNVTGILHIGEATNSSSDNNIEGCGRLRLVEGVVSDTGVVLAGVGFSSAAASGPSSVSVTFTTPFSSPPVVVLGSQGSTPSAQTSIASVSASRVVFNLSPETEAVHFVASSCSQS
jgi:hypothetical protein